MIKNVLIFFIFVLISCSTIQNDTVVLENPKPVQIDYDYIGTWVDSLGNIVFDIKESGNSIIFYYDDLSINIEKIEKKSNNNYILASKNKESILLNLKFYSDLSAEVFVYIDNTMVSRLLLDKI